MFNMIVVCMIEYNFFNRSGQTILIWHERYINKLKQEKLLLWYCTGVFKYDS